MMEGLYPCYGLTAVKELGRISKSVTLVFFFLAGISYLNKPFQVLSRTFLIISWFLALVILPLSHFIVRRNIISRFSWYGVLVVVFGNGSNAQKIVASLKQVRRLGWQPTTVLPVNAIKRGIRETQIETAIFAPSPGLSVANYARILNSNFRKVILVRRSDNLGSVWVEPHDLDGQLGLEFHYSLFSGFSRLTKRLMDLGIGLALSIMLAPLLAILCLLIFFDSPGRIFFR